MFSFIKRLLGITKPQADACSFKSVEIKPQPVPTEAPKATLKEANAVVKKAAPKAKKPTAPKKPAAPRKPVSTPKKPTAPKKPAAPRKPAVKTQPKAPVKKTIAK